MDAVDLLNRDFRNLLKLLTQLGDSSGGEATVKAFEELRAALNLHMKMEREVFYPSLESFDEVRPLIGQGYDDHLKIAGLVSDMSQITDQTTSKDWRDLLVQLNVAVDQHISAAENQLLPEAERLLRATRLQELFYELDGIRSEQSEKDTLIYPASRLGGDM